MRLVFASLAVAGCMKPAAPYVCQSNADCVRDGEQGTCEVIDRCSFADPSCPTGKRYSEHAGDQADRCVGEELPIDAGPDSAQLIDAGPDAPIDAFPDAPPIDAPPGPCPASYVALPGVTGHLYRKLTAPAGWTNQRAICGSDPATAYLAVPDDAAELAALVAFAGTQQWVGVSDAGDEGVFVTVLDVPATFLPWDTGEPDNAGNQDCVRSKGATFETAGCGGLLVAVCECEP